MKIVSYKSSNEGSYIVIKEGEVRLSKNVFMDLLKYELDSKSDYEIVNIVINYFTSKNQINKIYELNSIMTIEGDNNTLVIDSVSMKNEKNKLLLKYFVDREMFLYNSDNSLCRLDVDSHNSTSYNKSTDGYLNFEVACNNNSIKDNENVFIIKLLDYLFKEDMINIFNNDSEDVSKGVTLINKNSKVKVKKLTKELYDAVNEHNKKYFILKEEREQSKKLQMRMKGF